MNNLHTLNQGTQFNRKLSCPRVYAVALNQNIWMSTLCHIIKILQAMSDENTALQTINMWAVFRFYLYRLY